MKTSIIIVAAGKGERFGQPKMDLKLGGKTLLEWCLEIVKQLKFEKEVIVVSPPLSIPTNVEESLFWVEGGNTRFESVKTGLKQAKGELVIIHNVANPMVSAEDFNKVRDELMEGDSAVFAGQRVVDTLRRVTEEGSSTIDRKDAWRVQTPQGFRTKTLRNKIEQSTADDVSDEIQLFERDSSTAVGMEKIVAFETSPLNQKITYPADLELIKRFLGSETRVGIGEDSHYFDTSGTMIMGGVTIQELPKLHGNSDGDVILHALFNALSSAIGEGSLGPTADPMVKEGILDSSEFLKVILAKVRDRGYSLNNISISLECLTPKIEPLIPSLKNSLAQLLDLDAGKIGITATSGEGLTSFGKGEGIYCRCVMSLRIMP